MSSKTTRKNILKNLLIISSFSLFILTSCGQENSNQSNTGLNANVTTYAAEKQVASNPKQQNSNNGYKNYVVMSPDFGIPFGSMTIPNSWNESRNKAEKILFEGPGNLKVFEASTASHFYSNDPNFNQSWAQSGHSVRPPKSLEQFIGEDLNQMMQSLGFQFTGQYPLPQLSQLDTQFDSYLFKAMPEQKQYQCMVTEWKDQQGNPAMVIVRYSFTQYPTGTMDWGYTLNALSADKNAYGQAKTDFIASLVNFQINPQWVNANNQYWAQVAQQQNAGHQQRMADIQAQGQAILERGRANSAMMDANHQQFMNNLRSDGGHSEFIDYIRDEQNVTNTYDGQTYKVESGSNYYWMNSNGEYIQTDNPNWNPNTDPAYNNQTWNLTTGNK